MNVTVYCGANPGNKPQFIEAAKQLGALLAKRGHTLVYGAGGTGMMGALADAVLEGGGEVVGVIPDFLRTIEQAHFGITQTIVVKTMAQRKTHMIKLGEAFVALPGGIGTLEEITEVASLAKLKQLDAPCFVVNVAGCYDGLLQTLDDMVRDGFLESENRALLHAVASIDELAEILE